MARTQAFRKIISTLLFGGWVLPGLWGCVHAGSPASGDSKPTNQQCLDFSGRWEINRQLCTTKGNESYGGTATTSIPGQRFALVPSINNDTFWTSGTILQIEQQECARLRVRIEAPLDGPPLPTWHRDVIEIDLEGLTFPYRLSHARPGSPEDRSAWPRKTHRIELDGNSLRFKGKANGTRYEWQLGPIGTAGLHYRWKRRYREFPLGFASYHKEFVCTLPATTRQQAILQ